MDTHDVSAVDASTTLLKDQKKALQAARSREGQRCQTTAYREDIIHRFLFGRMTSFSEAFESEHFQITVMPQAYAPCVTALTGLKKVMIRNLTLKTHHRGSYILLRAVTPLQLDTSIKLIAEDEEENVISLTLYNQGPQVAMDGRLNEGRVVLVKEPYVQVQIYGGHEIRVDHLSDVRFLVSRDPEMPLVWRPRIMELNVSADDWKTRGDSYLAKKRYHRANAYYALALGSNPTAVEASRIRASRGRSYLKARQFEAALRDLELVTAEPDTEKVLLRKALALYHLQRFEEACEVHKVLGKGYPGNKTARYQFNRAIARLAEQRSGRYNFKTMQLEAKKHKDPALDHATYIGSVAVKPTESCGRGLFTTSAVKAGDLLFCEKAFMHVFHDERKTSAKRPSLLLNTETNTTMLGTQVELISSTIQKLYDNPSLMSVFNDLYHGSYEPIAVSEVDGVPIVDTFLVERIVSLNYLEYPRSSRDNHLRTITHGATGGIWCLASYINHSCYSNSHRAFIGDMIIVRATQDLPANTEIRFTYVQPLTDGNDPKENENGRPDFEHWGFNCSCVICLDALHTPKSDLALRETLLEQLNHEFKAQHPDTGKILPILTALEKTYSQPATNVPRLAIWTAYRDLSVMCMSRGLAHQAIGHALTCTEGMSLSVKQWGLLQGGLVGYWMVLAKAYRVVAPELVRLAVEYARITYRMLFGEDETFGDTYSLRSSRVDGFLVGAR
ncbi:TPR domain protein [Aspergillus homomorphus CBS 101889]|uniref:SET domain-containing protein n=1 Tax=Aspergillus homomorphus (strain CBS 101889) TaxID=1450537 RepID=A0A395ICW6_ASPHC|nr:SET domain-containing protein [Aspergillus homomorphus CBS 101889]RAL16978.1 SET domain-containing protein [Aspergillus homomorphus CBS 101889]